MICVSNSSPLIFLAKIEHAPLLKVCFEQVFVPRSVVQEVGSSLLPDISNLAVKDLDEAGQSFVADELGRLHRGELEALWLSRGYFGIGSPVSPGRAVSSGKVFSDEVTACEVDKGFARGRQGFVVSAEPTVVSKLDEGALDDPASGL